MFKIVCLCLAVFGLCIVPMVIGAAVDGGSLSGHIEWILSTGGSGDTPGIAGIASMIWAFLVIISLFAFHTSWWGREAGRWEPVAHLLLDGRACNCSSCQVQSKSGARRLGIVIAFMGVIALLGDLLELDVFRSVEQSITANSHDLCLVTIGVEGAAGLLMVLIGVFFPQLIIRPRMLFALSMLALLASFSAVFLEIAEHEALLTVFRKTKDALGYRESIAAIWITAFSCLGFTCTGGMFGVRQYQEYRERKIPTLGT